MPTAVNLFTLRGAEADLTALLEAVSTAGYDAVEPASPPVDADPATVAETAADHGLTLAPPHVGHDALAGGDVAAAWADAGAPALVLPYLEPDAFADAAAVDVTAERLDALAADLPLPLLYHNHDHELARVDGAFALDVLAEATDRVGFEVDVGWAHAAGADPVALLERLGDRVEAVHLKDVRDGEPCDPGEGDAPLADCLAAARALDVEWLVFEHDDPADAFEALTEGARLLGVAE